MTPPLQLDARQRAMLEEMGIKVWLPQAEAEAPAPARAPAPAAEDAAPQPAPETATPDSAPPRRGPAPAPVAAPAPQAAPASALGITLPERLYAADGQSATGGWLVVVDMPPDAGGRHEALLAGEAGRLLDQMLRALGLHAGTVPVHAVRLWRASPGQPHPEGAADFDTAFEAAAAPLAPRLVLALGMLSAQRLTGVQAPLGRLRGSAHAGSLAGAGCAVVASYPPAYLLRNSADKARAWADLCLAAETLQNG
ncbi:uracil-DNA glycosylase [Xenophilus arseniciresistens]|uniref:Uracil-DNA glycosylase n=1 Tax=Xenophilus arseniciresistens TaxID=1283306 RepID=A0AAE3ND55_9BURK|nr:uracil-DNA glycosylase family protein [Xenophilus arseniciresistens]MDA7419213.1 uracil-DNA glycosylase [Xenophilus arseniciresistens]